jgi:competence protein ComEC
VSRFFVGLFLCLAALLPAPNRASAAELALTFFDIGQGDAALIVSPTGKRVLVDGGPPEGTQALLDGLSQRGIDRIDLVLLSHPHLDHLGGLRKLLERVQVSMFLDAGYPSTSPPYTALLQALQDKKIPVTQATLGRNIDLGDGANLRVLGPPSPWLTHTRSDVNANSVVVRLTWRERTALFSGDAEPETERWLLSRYRSEPALLSAEVLKVPHHGGKYSSTAPFLAAVHPRWAVISVAAENDYHHPTPEAMARLAQAGAQLLRTDQNSQRGGITLRSRDGQPWVVETAGTPPAPAAKGPPVATAAPPEEKPAAPATALYYVGSSRSQVFHRASCAAAQKIVAKNRLNFMTRDEAVASGRRPAEDCHP